jgi:hypothetical protein
VQIITSCTTLPNNAVQGLPNSGFRSFIYRYSVGFDGHRIRPSQGLHLHRTTQTQNTQTYIYNSNGIRTHDASVPAVETAHELERVATLTSISYCKYIVTDENVPILAAIGNLVQSIKHTLKSIDKGVSFSFVDFVNRTILSRVCGDYIWVLD